MLLRLGSAYPDSLVALYGITRGNRRAYLHVEQLDNSGPLAPALPAATTLLRQLREDGRLTLPQLQAVEANWSELLARTLNLDSTLRVSISGSQAAAWQAALQEQGVRAVRLQLDVEEGDGLILQQLR